MNLEQLESNAKAMATKGKGLLAADESTGTIKKRLDTINTESTELNEENIEICYSQRKVWKIL